MLDDKRLLHCCVSRDRHFASAQSTLGAVFYAPANIGPIKMSVWGHERVIERCVCLLAASLAASGRKAASKAVQLYVYLSHCFACVCRGVQVQLGHAALNGSQ
jgi:hypothetical protein